MAKATDSTTPIPTTRRALLAGAPAAAAAALASGAVANTVALGIPRTDGLDPIFAAIERERSAYADYLATGAIQHEVSDQNPFPERKLDRRAEKKRLKSPEHKTWWARYQEAEKANTEAAQALWSAREAFLQTRPISVAGLIAFLDHIEGPLSTGDAGEAFWDEIEHELAFPTLAAAARNLITRGQA
jgi:hypothetical protein